MEKFNLFMVRNKTSYTVKIINLYIILFSQAAEVATHTRRLNYYCFPAGRGR